MHRISEDLSKWNLDESQLTKEDKEVLEIIRFPKSIGYRQALQKREKRIYINGAYADSQYSDINNITYVIVSKTAALKDAAATTHNGTKASKEFIEKAQRNRPNKFTYFDGKNIQAELESVLSKFSAPKPTPSMTAEPLEEKPKTKPKAKGLSNSHKAKIKELAEGGADADEIATELGKDRTLIINYLKKLSDA